MNFTGRTYELDYLNRLYTQSNSSLCVVYGRRRIGKTRLLTHWLETRKLPGFYWIATDTSATALLRSFSQAVYQQLHSAPPADVGFNYYDWDEAFRELARCAQQSPQKLVVILDEFTYAIAAYPDLTYKLQAAWDQMLKPLPLLLVLSGSQIGMMEDEILAQRSPLYGRATGLLQVRPWPFKDVRAAFPHYDVEACVALYSVLGGVPYYLEQMEPQLSVVENIIQHVMQSPLLVQDEPRLLLHDHFQQPGLYAAIIGQVANGENSPKAIADALGMEQGTVGSYLSTLVRIGLLERETPATERHPTRTRRSRYRVTDPYLRFYHRFLAPQLPFLLRGAYRAVWNTIEQHWRAFVGTHTFEELCREWIYGAAELGQLPFLPQQVGSHWGKTEQIDVVAINWDAGAVLYGECKWKRESALTLGEVEKLIERAAQIDLTTHSGRPLAKYYVFFSRSGFTEPAQNAANAVGAILVDLVAFDRVLAQALR